MYELFTLGGGTYLVDLLNAVAAITGGGAYITLAQLAGVAGLAWVLFRTAFGGSWRDNAKWMLLFVAVWGAMIVPKATVRVVDRLDPTLAPAVIANVPIGLALFASLTSQVGDGLTRLTEQAFTLPNDLQYRRHGLIFGARLAAKATRLEITDAVFARNVRNYARQCVFHALLLGHISADDLRESTDIWRLVTATGSPSAGTSPARMVEFATRQAATGTGATPVDRRIVTCRDAAGRLNALWNAEIARAGTVFGRRIFPDARTEALARAELIAALPAAHNFLIGASRTAGEIMRQQMVLDAVHDAGEQWAAEAGNAAALRAYTEARAEAQTVSAYRAIGRQAETWVPLLRIVFECLYVGAFPVAVLLMLTPAGTAIFRSYVTGLVWLQSWGPLYAVLHRISMGEAAERMQAARAHAGGGDIGVSLVAQAGIRAVATDVGGDVGLSVHVGALPRRRARLRPLQGDGAGYLGAGGRPGRRLVRRARGHDGQPLARQHGIRHAPLRHLEGRQIRTSAHVDTDRYTGYVPEGAAMTVTGDGTVVADAGAATSRIPAAEVRLSESLATSHETRAAEARSLSRHWSAEAGVARNAAVADATAMIGRYSHDVSTGEAFARGVTESESSQAQALESHYEKLSEIAGITKDQAAVLTGQASVGGSWDFIVKVGADGSVQWRGQTIESDVWNRIKDYDRQHGVTESWSQVSEASRRYSTQTGDRELASLDESLSANLTRMRTFQERASLARQESESWSEQAAQVTSDAQAIGRDLSPALLRLAVGAGGIGRARDRGGRGHAHRPAADGGGRRAAPGIRRPVHRREVPRTGRAGPGIGRRRGRVRRGRRGAARGLRPRDRCRVWRLVGGGARPGAGGGRAQARRDGNRGDGGTGRDEDRADHDGHGARGAADRDEGRGRRRARAGGEPGRKALRAARDGESSRRRRLARRQAVRHGEERRARRRRGEGADAGPEGLGRLLAVSGLAQMAVVAEDAVFPVPQVGVAAGPGRPVEQIAVVGEPVAAECAPVAVAEAAPEREGKGGGDRPADGGEPRRVGVFHARPRGGGYRGPERGNGEAAEHQGAFAPGGAAVRPWDIPVVQCARHVHGLRPYLRRRRSVSPPSVSDPASSTPVPFARPPPSSASGRR